MAKLSEIGTKIESTIPELEALPFKLELKAANVAEGLLALRTFSTGAQGVYDTKGNKLKVYSAGYAQKRKKFGLQVANKDLIFSKDNSIIMTNIKIGLSDGRPVLGFLKEKASLIAGYQEEQNNTKIFQLNDEERAEVIRQVKEFYISELKRITQKWH